MFCSKCGAQMPDGANFCGSCGQRVVMQQSNLNEPVIVIREPNRVDTTKNESVSDSFGKLKVYVKELAAKIGKESKLKWGVGIGAAVIVVAVIAIVVYVGYLNTGYKNVLDKYFTVLETADVDLYISILPDEWLEKACYIYPHFEDDPKEQVEMELNQAIVDDSNRWTWAGYVNVGFNSALRAKYGDEYEIDYKINHVDNITGDELFDLRKNLESKSLGAIYFEDVEKAVKVSVRADIKGNGESGILSYREPILLARIKGEWKLIPDEKASKSGFCLPMAISL